MVTRGTKDIKDTRDTRVIKDTNHQSTLPSVSLNLLQMRVEEDTAVDTSPITISTTMVTQTMATLTKVTTMVTQPKATTKDTTTDQVLGTGMEPTTTSSMETTTQVLPTEVMEDMVSKVPLVLGMTMMV